MKTKRTMIFAVVPALLLAAAVLAGCDTGTGNGNDNGNGNGNGKHAAYGNPPVTDTVTSSAESNGYGEYIEGHAASIDITLTLEAGYITEVAFEHSGHTEGIGVPIIEKAKTTIVEQNKILIDVVAGVSVTPKLINRAGQNALAKIPGYTPD
jgi:predicted small secreted protein